MNLVDSSGWIEYLQDTPRADLFADAIENRYRLLVPTIALFEVHKILSRALGPLVAQSLDVMRRGRVLDLTDARDSSITSRSPPQTGDGRCSDVLHSPGIWRDVLDARCGL